MDVSRIFWDTNLFIYLLEGGHARAEQVAALRRRMLERRDQLCTSTLTLGEVLVKPMERADASLVTRYTQALDQTVQMIAFDREAARLYAHLRQDRAIRPPDAIQLACAGTAGVDLFITNDDRLSRCTVPGVQFVTSLDRAFL